MILVVNLQPTFQHTLRFERFALGQVNRAVEAYLDPSGKGANVVRVLGQIGKQALLLTHLASGNRRMMEELYARDGIPYRAVAAPGRMRTCTTALHHGQATELIGLGDGVDAGTEAALIAAFRDVLPSASVVVLTGTKAKGYTPTLFPLLAGAAKEAGKTLILDAQGDDLEHCLPCRPDVIKPNEKEFAATFLHRDIPENEPCVELDGAVKAQMRRIHDTWGCAVVLTRGSLDTWVQEEEAYAVPVERVEAVNTIGCGDAFTAGMAAALEAGRTIRDAVAYATTLAARNARSVHPGSLDRPSPSPHRRRCP